VAADVEILVHDDASTDGSVVLLQQRHPRVTVITGEANVGYCISNNRLAQRARGEFLLLLNNDAALQAGALQSLLNAAQGGRDMDVFTLPQYDWSSGALVDRGVRMDFLYTPVPNRAMHCTQLAYVQGACLWIRRESWERLGGFPDWMGSNAEDMYLCLLARLHGGGIHVVEGSGYVHRQGTSFGGNRVAGGRLQTSYRRRYLSERNRACTLLVCTPSWVAWPWSAFDVLALAVEGLLVTLLTFDRRVWTGIYGPAIGSALRLIPTLRGARRTAQAGRVLGFWGYVRMLHWMPQKLRVLLGHGVPKLR
jgi:GT2 family glycosyltransferase